MRDEGQICRIRTPRDQSVPMKGDDCASCPLSFEKSVSMANCSTGTDHDAAQKNTESEWWFPNQPQKASIPSHHICLVCPPRHLCRPASTYKRLVSTDRLRVRTLADFLFCRHGRKEKGRLCPRCGHARLSLVSLMLILPFR